MPMEDGEDVGERQAPRQATLREWFFNRGWIIIGVIALLQAVFASVVLSLRGSYRPARIAPHAEVRQLAVDMLGREVGISGINQVISGSRRRRMTIGLDLVLVLGQLPEERIEGAPRPAEEEMEEFMAAITAMDSKIRSRMINLLQGVDYDDYGGPEVLETFKTEIADYVNGELEKLSFPSVRPDIGRRRVTEALLPMFVRQTF
jgi:hypothetical protein